MRIHAGFRVARRLMLAVMATMAVIAPLGCGGDTGATTGSSPLPKEAEQANKNMEDFMKNQQKK